MERVRRRASDNMAQDPATDRAVTSHPGVPSFVALNAIIAKVATTNTPTAPRSQRGRLSAASTMGARAPCGNCPSGVPGGALGVLPREASLPLRLDHQRYQIEAHSTSLCLDDSPRGHRRAS